MDALSPWARWHSFRPQPEMPGCWTPQINLRPDSPGMGTQNQSTSRKPTLTLPSAGKVPTVLKGAHLCTRTKIPAGSLQSLATPQVKLLNWAEQQISNMFG